MTAVLLVTELEIYFILQARFLDLNDTLTFKILEDTMNATDDSLKHLVGRSPFKISIDQLQLNFDVQDATMRGMFIFKVQVINLGQFLQYWSLVRT
jgi:hypothetical protein